MHTSLLPLCLVILSFCYKVSVVINMCTDTDNIVATKKSANPQQVSRNSNWMIKIFVSLYSKP